MYWFWGNTAVKEMSETIWVWCPLIIIIIPILKHFIDGIITGHLVFELVKLPPPNGDEERPEKVSLHCYSHFNTLIYLALLQVCVISLMSIKITMIMTRTGLSPVLEVGRGVSRKKWINKSSR